MKHCPLLFVKGKGRRFLTRISVVVFEGCGAVFLLCRFMRVRNGFGGLSGFVVIHFDAGFE